MQINKGLTICDHSVDLPRIKGITATELDDCANVTFAIHEKIPDILLDMLDAADQRMCIDTCPYA